MTVQTNVPAYIEQTETTEVTVGRETQIATHRIVFDAIVTLDGSDEVTIDNKAYQIVGPPWNVDRPPFGPHHTEALAREVTI